MPVGLPHGINPGFPDASARLREEAQDGDGGGHPGRERGVLALVDPGEALDGSMRSAVVVGTFHRQFLRPPPGHAAALRAVNEGVPFGDCQGESQLMPVRRGIPGSPYQRDALWIVRAGSCELRIGR